MQLRDIFDSAGLTLPNAQGLEAFQTEIQKIVSSFISDETSDDWTKAKQAFDVSLLPRLLPFHSIRSTQAPSIPFLLLASVVPI